MWNRINEWNMINDQYAKPSKSNDFFVFKEFLWCGSWLAFFASSYSIISSPFTIAPFRALYFIVQLSDFYLYLLVFYECTLMIRAKLNVTHNWCVGCSDRFLFRFYTPSALQGTQWQQKQREMLNKLRTHREAMQYIQWNSDI